MKTKYGWVNSQSDEDGERVVTLKDMKEMQNQTPPGDTVSFNCEGKAVVPSVAFRGTPKTLEGAIQNAIDEAEIVFTDSRARMLNGKIYLHVRDFLAQKFTMDIMDLPEVRKLWEKITGEKL